MDLPDVEARGVPVRVVSAVTERGIIRGISHFSSIADVELEVRKAVGILLDDVEWSTHSYRMPSYVNDLAGFSGWDVPSGIYLFRWTADTKDWRNPDRRFSASVPEFLFRPSGWAGPKDLAAINLGHQ